jgi:hypothetical protein
MTTSTHNKVKPLRFSGPHIDAKFVEEARDYPIQGYTIVINPHLSDVYAGGSPRTIIPAFSSTILKDTSIEQAASLILLEVKETTNMGNIILEPDWDLYGKLISTPPSRNTSTNIPYPSNTPLWRSPQESVGSIEFDPFVILKQATMPKERSKFLLKVNLWFAPAQTNCFIHNKHDFLEIHAQIYGQGRMQKFKAQDYGTLYEDLLMSPGYTTSVPFCSAQAQDQFLYPWHQYYADTDCIWLALEYHPAVSKTIE